MGAAEDEIEQDRSKFFPEFGMATRLALLVSVIIYNKDFPTWEAVMAVEPRETGMKRKLKSVSSGRVTRFAGGQKSILHICGIFLKGRVLVKRPACSRRRFLPGCCFESSVFALPAIR